MKVKIKVELSDEKSKILSAVNPVLYADKKNRKNYQNIDEIKEKLSEIETLGMINEFAMEKFDIVVDDDSDPVYLVNPKDIVLKRGFYHVDKCLVLSSSSGKISINVKSDFKIHEFKEDYIFVIQ